MNKFIALLLVLFCSTAFAEETFCAQNESKGEIHLFTSKEKVFQAITMQPNGTFNKGTWALISNTRVAVIWDENGKSVYRIYPLGLFQKCEF